MRFKTALLSLTMPLALAACSSGGGGGGSSSGQSVPLTLDSTASDFTSFSDITANSLVQLDSPDLIDGGDNPVPLSLNKAMELDGGLVPVAGGNVTGTQTTTTEQSFIRLLYGDLDTDGDPEEEAIRLSVGLPGADPIDFDVDEDGREIDQALPGDPPSIADYVAFEITDTADDVTDRLVVHAPEDEADDLDFMTFGVWQLDRFESIGNFGGAAWGRLTAVADMPPTTAPDATYTGGLLGQHVSEGDGVVTLYEAVSTVSANFLDATVTLSSSGTRNLETGAAFDALNLQMQAGQTAPLTGNYFVSADDALRLTSTADAVGQFGGAFYGPNAEETGGWFDITNTGNNSRYFGSFGAKQ